MSIATRAATCTACGKRLNRKRWYYRNGHYFCTKRCWVTEQEKAAEKAAKETAKAAPAAEASKPEPAAAPEKPAASS
mgnify:CR=1 FL=1